MRNHDDICRKEEARWAVRTCVDARATTCTLVMSTQSQELCTPQGSRELLSQGCYLEDIRKVRAMPVPVLMR